VSRTAGITGEALTARSDDGNGAVRAAIALYGAQDPTAFVDEPVMEPAQQQRVVSIGGSSVLPRDQVVGVGVARRAMASWPTAAAIASSEQSSLPWGEESAGAPEVDDRPLAVKQQCCELCVARDSHDAGRVKRPPSPADTARVRPDRPRR